VIIHHLLIQIQNWTVGHICMADLHHIEFYSLILYTLGNSYYSYIVEIAVSNIDDHGSNENSLLFATRFLACD
jgi:hypothetical protein